MFWNKGKKKPVEIFAWTLASTACFMFIIPFICYWVAGFTYNFTEYAIFVGGTAGPLAALAGFLFVYIAFKGQQRQIENNKLQFEKQSFESSFFNLLNYYKDFIAEVSIDTEDGRVTIEGFQDYLVDYLSDVRFEVDVDAEEDGTDDILMKSTTYSPDELKGCLYERFNYSRHHIKNLFKPLISILLLIREENIGDKEKYFRILDNLVSESEKFILFYFYVTYRPALLSDTEYALILDFLKRTEQDILLEESHLDWLFHLPYTAHS